MNITSEQAIGRIYSKPLFDLAVEAGQSEVVRDELSNLTNVFSEQAEISEFANLPFIRPEEKREVFKKVFAGQVSELTLNFLLVAVDRRRLSCLKYIASEYENLLDIHQGKKIINVTVAKLLSEEQSDKLKSDLAEAVGGEVKLCVDVDPNILWGIIIRDNERLVDNSIRSILSKMIHQISSVESKKQDEI